MQFLYSLDINDLGDSKVEQSKDSQTKIQNKNKNH